MIAAIVVSIVALLAIAAAAILAERVTRRPVLEEPRPFRCLECRCSFRDQRWLGMHSRAQHSDQGVRRLPWPEVNARRSA